MYKRQDLIDVGNTVAVGVLVVVKLEGVAAVRKGKAARSGQRSGEIGRAGGRKGGRGNGGAARACAACDAQ